LRGQARNGSDALTRDMAARLGIDLIDLPLESRGAPQRDRILMLAETFDSMRTPAVMHCKSGADRAGLAAGLFVLLRGGSAAQAMAQLSLRYGHFSLSRTGILDAFFRLYANEAEGRKPFLRWVHDDYDETELLRSFRARWFATFINDRLLARE
jgi:hypothetical protein